MTNWLPKLPETGGPLYQRLADAIENDISSGSLPQGAKLPPQRNLAYDIGVTIGTVTRAYNLVRERGLVSGEVGRGTFVTGGGIANVARTDARSSSFDGTRPHPPAADNIRMDTTSAIDVGQGEVLAAIVADVARRHADRIGDYSRSIPGDWREAGRKWLSQDGWTPDVEAVVPTVGAHAGVMAVIAAVTAPGDRVVFEHLTYSSISRSAGLIGRRSVTVASDQHGTDPDDFERVCAQQHPRLAFFIPSNHNPTLVTTTEERRRAIAEIARRHNVWLVEDAIFGALMSRQPPPLAGFAPERTFRLASLSKAVSAGIRGGWVACPPQLAPRVVTAHRMITGGQPYLLAQVAADLVNTGEADRIRARVRAEIGRREVFARESFFGAEFASHPEAPFLWMKLPEPWTSATFKQVAAAEGVLVDDEDEYKPGRSENTYHRVRIGFSYPRDHDEVRRGFATLRRLMDHARAGYDSYG
jgi:DNA-binding transcriptional MocR family regulator